MNIDLIRKRLKGGFRPFMLRTSDGREYEVPHPEFVLVASRTLAVMDADGDIVTLDPLHVAALKDLPSKKNGTEKG